MSRRVLVAGGAGFLGSHLCDAFIAAGDVVIAVDNLCTGRPSNVEHLRDVPGFSLVHHDIRQPLAVDGPLDVVMNLASPASPKDYFALPLETLTAGSEGTRHLLELAEAKAARFVLASTSEVYGDPTVHPQLESYWGHVNPVGVRSVYDEAKRYAEAITMCFSRERSLDAGIVRVFNTYGPRMRPDDGRVVSNFIVQALQGRPLTVYGDGSQSRSFCYVADEIAGFMAMAASGANGPINIGSPVEFTMLELAKLVLELADSVSEIVFEPLPADDPRQRRPDISLATATLGWEPAVPLVDGLRSTIDWFRAELR